AAIVASRPRPRGGMSPLRTLGVTASLLAAILVLFGILAPTATVVVAPVSQALGPLEFDLRAGPGGADVNAQTLGPATITAKFSGTATGSRTEDIKAKGSVKFTNQTTNAIRIAKNTVVSASDNIRFWTTEEKMLPGSSIQIFPPSVVFGTVDVAIEAIEPGPRGNVDAKKINQSPAPGQYSVENPQPTTGGETRKIPIVQLGDYDLAVSRADGELRKQGDAQVETWKKQAAQGRSVYGVVVKRKDITPASDVVGKELPPEQPSFDLIATGTATGYSVPDSEPRAKAVERLGQSAASGYDIDKAGAVVAVVSTSVEDDGVHWRVRGSASQFRRLDDAAIRSALAGRAFEDADALVADRGLRLVRISTWPGWWPRLPVLDSRIVIQSEARAAASP
ncbi:MAG TPA: baseplate J/gp47 family protein, partial [Candidatus Limnocylindria bacterium]|nr:baseplate J/gp47 family protein [Candidatus Limnocylindria bacterium]